MENKKFICVVRRGYHHLRIPRAFYSNYSATFPRSLSLKDKFGLRVQAKLCMHDHNRAYLKCHCDQILDAYQFNDSAVIQLTYRSRGKFWMLVLPNSGDFVRERGVAAGANADQEAAIEPEVDAHAGIPVYQGPDLASDTDSGSVVD